MSGEHEQQRLAVDSIMTEALAFIDDAYGAEPEQPGTKLAYHNGLHTRQVIADFTTLATALSMPQEDRFIGLVSASAHDLIHGTGRGHDETASAEWLVEKLASTECFSASQRHMARLAILGTEPLFENGLMLSQVANEQDYPSERHERVAKAVASADLGRLYTPDGPFMAHLLYKEMTGNKSPDPLENILNFLRNQPLFLESYNYPLAKAAEVFGSQRQRVIAYVGQLIVDIESGTIENWQQLLQADRQFAAS